MYRSIYIKTSLFACALGGFVVLLFLLGVGRTSIVALASSISGVGNVSQTPEVPNGKLASSAPDCGSVWEYEPSPPIDRTFLRGVAALSSSDIWAVGGYYYDGALIEHYDGTAWSVVPSPNVDGVAGGLPGGLTAVAASASNDVWAVGSTCCGPTVIEHWDGTAWSIVASPSYGSLNGIAIVSSNDVWAVGEYNNGREETLAVHWNGTVWTEISPLEFGALNAVAAVSSNDVWAVGHTSGETLTEHWDGSAWNVVPSVDPFPNNYLTGVSAISSSDVWAVGYSAGAPGPRAVTLVEHWDGSVWSIVTSPNVGTQDNYLNAISAISSNDVWAVGNTYGGLSQPPLIEHWDGSSWTIAQSPGSNGLMGIASLPNGDVWAVGIAYTSTSFQGLVLSYSPAPCPPTPTPTPVRPRCPGERFTDVCPGDYFYQHVLDLNDLGIVSGYNSAPPCEGIAYIPCFKPYNWTTRGQISKVVSLAAGFNDPVSGQTFADVLPDHTFYAYIERMAARGIIVGYPCGGSGEPCDANNRPYFRPGNSVGRGQLTKMVALAFDLGTSTSGQTFEDVVPGYTFYPYIERLAVLGIIQGYPCGNAGEPCVPPDDRPYFRPANIISRGQISKIVNLARTQSTTPSPTPTSTAVISTPTFTVTPLPSATETLTPTATSQATETPSATATSAATSTP